jgi:hypothetical protein
MTDRSAGGHPDEVRGAFAAWRGATTIAVVALVTMGPACGDRSDLGPVSANPGSVAADDGGPEEAGGEVTCQYGGLAAAGGNGAGPAECSGVEADGSCGRDRYIVRCACPGTTCTCIKNRDAVGTATTSACSSCTTPADAWRACGFPSP